MLPRRASLSTGTVHADVCSSLVAPGASATVCRGAAIDHHPPQRPPLADAVCRGAGVWFALAGGGSVWSGGLWPGVLAGWLGVFVSAGYPAAPSHGVADGQCLCHDRLLHLGDHQPPAAGRHAAGAGHGGHAEQYDLPVLPGEPAWQPVLFHGGGDWRVFSGRAAASTIQGGLVGAGLSAGLRGGFCLQPVYSVAPPATAGAAFATRQL